MADARLTVPIYVSGSHVRLTDAHARALFHELTPLAPLGESELRPCLERVRVRVGDTELEDLRVVVGPVDATEVRLHRARYGEDRGLDEPVHLDGPDGTVVLATAPRLVGRHLTLSETDRAALGDASAFTVHVAADRARVFHEVPAEPARVSALWVEADDLNSLDLSPDARALIL